MYATPINIETPFYTDDARLAFPMDAQQWYTAGSLGRGIARGVQNGSTRC